MNQYEVSFSLDGVKHCWLIDDFQRSKRIAKLLAQRYNTKVAIKGYCKKKQINISNRSQKIYYSKSYEVDRINIPFNFAEKSSTSEAGVDSIRLTNLTELKTRGGVKKNKNLKNANDKIQKLAERAQLGLELFP